MINVKIELSSDKVDITEYGGMVIKDTDREIEVVLSLDLVYKLFESARKYEGERTIEELEDKILKLEADKEELKGIVEQ
jgi:hypothetical protein